MGLPLRMCNIMCAWKSELYCTAFNKTQFPPAGAAEVVLAGRSNVGKSTLINALLGCRIAKVSSTPGKTRSINFYKVDAGGMRFHLVDIPGYGYAGRGAGERRAWRRLIEDYFFSGRNVLYVIHLIDFRHGPLANDSELTSWLDEMDMPRLVVFTKGDKISGGKRKALYEQYMKRGMDSVLPPFITSGRNDGGMEALRAGITDIITEMRRLEALETGMTTG